MVPSMERVAVPSYFRWLRKSLFRSSRPVSRHDARLLRGSDDYGIGGLLFSFLDAGGAQRGLSRCQRSENPNRQPHQNFKGPGKMLLDSAGPAK